MIAIIIGHQIDGFGLPQEIGLVRPSQRTLTSYRFGKTVYFKDLLVWFLAASFNNGSSPMQL